MGVLAGAELIATCSCATGRPQWTMSDGEVITGRQDFTAYMQEQGVSVGEEQGEHRVLWSKPCACVCVCVGPWSAVCLLNKPSCHHLQPAAYRQCLIEQQTCSKHAHRAIITCCTAQAETVGTCCKLFACLTQSVLHALQAHCMPLWQLHACTLSRWTEEDEEVEEAAAAPAPAAAAPMAPRLLSKPINSGPLPRALSTMRKPANHNPLPWQLRLVPQQALKHVDNTG